MTAGGTLTLKARRDGESILAEVLDQGSGIPPEAQLHANESSAEPWANSIIAYVMAISSVLAALTALENGRTTSARLENVASLAHWSKAYAAQAYHFTKALGLLKRS